MGIDRPRGGSDRSPEGGERPRETNTNLWTPRPGWGQPPTTESIERQKLITRGELRYNHNTGQYEKSEPHDWVKKEDLVARMREVELPKRIQDYPLAWDMLPADLHWNWADIDRRKFHEYSMNPEHADNRGKANGWEALGYNVRDPEARDEAAWEVVDITRMLLPYGHVESTRESDYGTKYAVVNGFIGPNDRTANLWTSWMVEGERDRKYPRLVTVWVQPHRNKEG